MKYFAYGSNMLKARLEERVGLVSPGVTASIRAYRLRFHKKSSDDSGKCNMIYTGSQKDVVYGVVFEISEAQKCKLDQAEGLGCGYDIKEIPIRLPDGTEKFARAYVAVSSAIDDAVVPYSWYQKLVIAGAEQHNFPGDYIAGLQAVPYAEDPKRDRKTKRDAERILDAYRAHSISNPSLGKS
jgi:gamma-glutamylcyclotransferase